MARLIVRNPEDAVKVKLQRQARRHGRSVQEEVREILGRAAHEDESRSGGLGTDDIAALFKKAGLTKDIAEFSGHKISPPKRTR